MEVTVILGVVQVVLYILLGGLALWFKTNGKLNKAVSALIDKAEEEFTGFKQGNEKFKTVVGWLYDLIPTVLKPFFPQKFVEALVQNAFDQITSFAKKQLDKAIDNVIEKVEDNNKTSQEEVM